MSILPAYLYCMGNMAIYLAGAYNECMSQGRFSTLYYTEPVYSVGFSDSKMM